MRARLVDCTADTELRRNAELAVKELSELHRGKVTISANEHTVFYLLPVIMEFRRLHPHIKVEVKRGVASRIPKEIASREVELGVLSFKPADAGLKAMQVLTDELVLIVAPGHRLAGAENISIKELADETFIAHNAKSPYREKVIECFVTTGHRLGSRSSFRRLRRSSGWSSGTLALRLCPD